MSFEFLDVDDVLAIHEIQVASHGGDPGVRDLGLLDSAVAMPRATFGGQFLHEDPFSIAAAYLFHIAKNHAFVDGNKRTALVAALTFLDLNGYPIERPSPLLYNATIDVVEGLIDKAELADLLRDLAGHNR